MFMFCPCKCLLLTTSTVIGVTVYVVKETGVMSISD